MNDFGKLLMIIGGGLAALGLLFWLGNKIGIPFGKLPGDIHVSSDNSSFYFPVVTSIVVSILLTIVLNLIFGFMRK